MNTWSLCCCVAFASALSACGTPQQRAVGVYCKALANDSVPPLLEYQNVVRNVQVGEKLVVLEEVCPGDEPRDKKSKPFDRDKKESDAKRCKWVPKYEPVYEDRVFYEQVDINTQKRQLVKSECEANSLKKGMFKELNQ